MTPQQKSQRQWENYINKECTHLAEKSLCWVSKNHEAPTIPGTNVPRAKSKPDYSGFFRNDCHVVFEAKATQLSTRFDLSKISPHQFEHLDHAYNCGCASFVYVLDGKKRKWLFPWKHVLYVEQGRASIPFDTDVYLKRKGETWLDTWWRLEGDGHA